MKAKKISRERERDRLLIFVLKTKIAVKRGNLLDLPKKKKYENGSDYHHHQNTS